jgi:hypothetical protein
VRLTGRPDDAPGPVEPGGAGASAGPADPLGPVDYVLPLRWTDDRELAELTAYLRWLARRVRVIVVDGSPAPLYARHAAAWAGLVRHVRPQGPPTRNGKVAGVHTGLALARAEAVVVADDDVRYDEEALRRVVRLLDRADLVGPQNVFAPLPWHAAWDTARSLLNRAVAADYPGTFGVRRSTFVAMGGYDGDVLFENLELIRTVRAFGGRVLRPLDLYVVRRPPTAGRFWSQRVRQAYDDLAQPWRLLPFLAALPVGGHVLRRHGPRPLVGAALASVAVAEVGRRRAGGRRFFPARASWFAPAWLAERAVCCWLAVGQRVLLGGVGYSGSRLRVAAHLPWRLRRRFRTRAVVAAAGPEAHRGVRAVAERLEGGAPAAAQRDGVPAGVDAPAGEVLQHDVPAHDERPVGVRHDGRRGRRVGVGPRIAHGRRAGSRPGQGHGPDVPVAGAGKTPA